MKKYFWILLSLICLIWTSVFATYEDFSNQLKTMGVDVKKIEAQDNISRYDLARLLNTVECKDCVNPNQNMINRYTQNFWSIFTATPGKDFADISFLSGIYNNASYYYCVAYVGDNTYMRWYPKATSPVCGGQFCGIKNTTTAEFIQVVINILAKYIFKDLTLNRKEVNTWINTLKIDSYEAKNFTIDDKNTIIAKSKTCENNCGLQNANEVSLYLKYCMFNIAKCSMQEVGKIKQWYRPVAELNLLYRQNIIDIDQSLRRNTDKNIDGKTVVETLFKINGKVSCAFNNDYECDGVNNAKDNCSNTFNPSQKDADKDKLGDVCDNDIDGDGIKNPIGIVDDEGNVDIAKRTKDIDNCLFMTNTGQIDSNQNNIGDICENINDQIGIYITIDKISWSAPLSTKFTAITSWDIKEIVWDFWDGKQSKGKSVNHTFTLPNMYTIQATAKGNGRDAKAQVIVVVGGQIWDDRSLQTRASVVGGNINTESTLSASLGGNFDTIERIFPQEHIVTKKAPGESIKRIFKQTGENYVLVKWYNEWVLVGVSYFTMGIGEWKGAILRSNESSSEVNKKIFFDTKTHNINQSDIVQVDWDFWEEIKIRNTTLTMEHAFTQPGKRVITQTILLTDGKTLINMITIYITDKTRLWSYALLMTPSTLIANVWDKINFSTRIIWSLLKTPIIQIAEFSDWTTQKKDWTDKMPSIFIHTYQKNGMLTPQDSMYINQCTYLKNQITLAIKGIDACLDTKTQNNLQTYKCDLDGDGIADICDTDIDGDGIQNLLGLIAFENRNCSYESDTNKNNANLNQDILTKHYQWVCSLDNAPFSNNPDQLDLNQDGIGDKQDTTFSIGSGDVIDTDGDWIPDSKDLCPTIQETWNGIQDEDGCPEIALEFGCNQQGIVPNIDITNDDIIINPIDIDILPPSSSCGDWIIDAGENCITCPADVGICTSFCWDGIQAAGENCINCPADVPVCGMCWNGIKDPNEDCETCPQDYGICVGSLCGNGIIDQWEICTNCPQDVKLCIALPACGDWIINTGENCVTCPTDVGICTSFCWDGIQAAGENCINCPADVPICGICWNGIQDPNEDCETCPQDYGICSGSVCGNGIIDPGESCKNCPQDVKLCVDVPNIGTCNQCPCQFADYASDLTNSDQVRAILRDKKKTIQYRFSQPWIVDFQQQ